MAQPDPRIGMDALGALIHDDESYLIHDAKGCPKTALIEIFDGYLRCSSCFTALADPAAESVIGFEYQPTPWKETGRGTFKLKK